MSTITLVNTNTTYTTIKEALIAANGQDYGSETTIEISGVVEDSIGAVTQTFPNGLVIRAKQGEEFQGISGQGAAIRSVTETAANFFSPRTTSKIRFENLTLELEGAYCGRLFYSDEWNSMDIEIDGCFLSAGAGVSGTYNGELLYLRTSNLSQRFIVNNSVIRTRGGLVRIREGANFSNTEVQLTSCTILDTGTRKTDLATLVADYSYITVKDSYIADGNNADVSGSTAVLSYVATSDATSYGTGAVIGVSSADAVTDKGAGDYTLKAGSVLVGAASDGGDIGYTAPPTDSSTSGGGSQPTDPTSAPALLSELATNTVTTVIPKIKTTGTKSPNLGMVDGHTGSAYSPSTKKFIALYGSDTHNSKNAWNSYFAIDFDQTLAQLNTQLVDDWKTRPWQQWGNDSDYPVAGFGATRNEFRSYLDAGQSGADDTALGSYNPPCHAYHLDGQIVVNELGEDLLLSTFSSTAHMFLQTGHDYAPDDSSRFASGNLGYRVFVESGASSEAQTPIINLSDYSEDSMIVTDVGQHSSVRKVISSRGRAWIDNNSFYTSDSSNGMVMKATVNVVGNRVTITDVKTGLTPFGLWPYHEHLKNILVGDYLTAFYGEISKGKFFHIAKVSGLSDSAKHLSVSLSQLKADNNILCDDGVTSLWDTTSNMNYPVTKVSDDCIAMIAYDGTDTSKKTGRLLLWKIPKHDGSSWDGIGTVIDTGLRYDYQKATSSNYQFNITNIASYSDGIYIPFVDKQNDQWDLQIGKLDTNLGTYFGGSQPNDTTAPTISLNAPTAIQLNIGDTYTAPAVTASDDTDGDLTGAIIVSGADFDTSVAGGPYEVIFSVEDSALNRSTVSQFVTVLSSTVLPQIDNTHSPLVDNTGQVWSTGTLDVYIARADNPLALVLTQSGVSISAQGVFNISSNSLTIGVEYVILFVKDTGEFGSAKIVAT